MGFENKQIYRAGDEVPFTINPDNEYQYFDSPPDQRYKIVSGLLALWFSSCPVEFTYNIETSMYGRLHAHGKFSIKDNKEVLPLATFIGRIKYVKKQHIDLGFEDNEWTEYCNKDLNIIAPDTNYNNAKCKKLIRPSSDDPVNQKDIDGFFTTKKRKLKR